jgi:hypothetical protein
MKYSAASVIGLLFMVSQPLFSQNSIDNFLLSAQKAPEVLSIDAQLSYLEGKPYRLAPIQRVEFRTESNQLDRERQDYGLRFNPANPWEMRNNNRYFKTYEAMLALEKGMALEEALFERYLLVVDLMYHEELRIIKKDGSELVDSYLSILEEQQFSTFFDGEDYVELKLDHIDNAVEVEEEAFQRDDVLRKMKGLDSEVVLDDSAWHQQQIISLETLLKFVDTVAYDRSVAPSLRYFDQRINLAEREYLLERSNINVGFVQAQYQEFRIEQGRRPWSVSLGVTIPIFNPNKGDMTKRKLEIMEDTYEKQEVKLEMEADSIRSRERIRSLMKRYQGVQGKIKDLQESTLGGTLKAMEGNNPAVQIRLASNILKLQVISLRLKQSILYAYVDFLAATDLLQKKPLINYLSPTLEQMEK